MSPGARRLLLAGFVLASCSACAQPLTHERWSGLRLGATADAVSATLGEPQRRADHCWLYRDDRRGITARIYLEQGRLIGKYWADPDYGVVRVGLETKSNVATQPARSP